MVKRMLSIIIIIFGVTSLVAAYQHHSNTDKASVTMYVSRRPIEAEMYYNQEVDSQPDLVSDDISNIIETTPTPIIVGEKELVSIFSADLEIEKEDLSKKEEVKDSEEDITQYTYDVSDKEREILERIVEAETQGQSLEARKNVVSVIINRVESSKFPESIKKVVFQQNGGTYQFSPIKDGRYYSVEITEETILAVEEVLKDGVINKALYFCNPADVKSAKNKNWFKKLKYLFSDSSGHGFYTE